MMDVGTDFFRAAPLRRDVLDPPSPAHVGQRSDVSPFALSVVAPMAAAERESERPGDRATSPLKGSVLASSAELPIMCMDRLAQAGGSEKTYSRLKFIEND